MRLRIAPLVVALSFACGCSHVESGQAPSLAASKTYTEADVSKALRDAEQFATEGKNEQALERHIWYHENALKYDPAQYGVRLSFALSSWVQLGKAYPKALEALRSTRDQALAAYRKSPADSLMFGEVLSLDLAIDDLPSAKELFYEGRQHKVTDSLLMLQLDRILATSDLKWANDVIGDPQEKLEEIKRQREMAELSLTDVKDPNQVKQSLDGVFSTQIATLLRAVERIHGRPAAEKIQKAALKFLDSTEVRNALKG